MVKSWGFRSFLQLLLCLPLIAADNKLDTERIDWIRGLKEPPTPVPTKINDSKELLDLVLQRNGDIRAQYNEWQGSLENTRSIASLPDPTLGLGYYLKPVETAQGPQTLKLSLGQTIPWFSKIRAERKGSEFHAVQSFEALQTLRLSLERDVRNLWAQAGQIQASISIIETKLNLSKDLEKVLHIQYQSASISHKQLFEVQIQTLQLQNKLQDLQSRYERLRVQLGDLLEQDSAVSEEFLPPISLITQEQEQDSGIPLDHPRLNRLEATKNEAGALITQARAAFIPDIKIGLDYIITDKRENNGIAVEESGKDPLIISAGLALPLWNWKSKKATVRSSEWKLKQARTLQDAELNRFRHEYEIARSMLGEQLRKVHLYEDQLIPKAQEIESVVQQEYISQSSDVFSYTMARQKVLDLQMDLVNAKYSAQLQLADLQYLKGN